MTRDGVRHQSDADLIVVGGGVIGLAIALEAGDAGLRVRLLDAGHPGAASFASAGMLAPSVERPADSDTLPLAERARLRTAHAVALRSRDRYLRWIPELAERAGLEIPHNRRGVIQLAANDTTAEALQAELPEGSAWLTGDQLARLEPTLRAGAGATLHPHDGAVDNVALMAALQRIVGTHAGIVRHGARAVAVDPGPGGRGVLVETSDGTRYGAGHLVIATGAWTSTLAGLPRPLAVEAVRGQMVHVAVAGPAHVVYGPGGYILPRAGGTLVGATMEHVGLVVATTDDGVASLRAASARFCPSIEGAAELARWAGLRPITPDFLPLLGPDPQWPALVYAVGHSRNGILLAPETASLLLPILLGRPADPALAAYDPTRFDRREHRPTPHSE